MENVLGFLRINVDRGIDLAKRNGSSSNPYVVISLGKQKLKTRVVNKNANPEWNEDLTLAITHPDLPIKLAVYDDDVFKSNNKMGDAEFYIGPFVEALKTRLEGLPSGTIIKRIQPSRQNCLSEESCITYTKGNVVQTICLRLRNVECGEVEVQLQWTDTTPAFRGL